MHLIPCYAIIKPKRNLLEYAESDLGFYTLRRLFVLKNSLDHVRFHDFGRDLLSKNVSHRIRLNQEIILVDATEQAIERPKKTEITL